MRAEKILMKLAMGLSRSQSREAVELGWVHDIGTGKPVTVFQSFSSEADLNLDVLNSKFQEIRKGTDVKGVKIIEKREDFVVIHKPGGIHSHPLKLEDRETLTHWAFFHFPQTAKLFPTFQPTLTPHRLDKGTEGLQIIALTPEAFERIRGFFVEKKVTKKYHAWVWGQLPEPKEVIETPLAHHATDKRKMVTGNNLKNVRGALMPAKSIVQALSFNEKQNASLVEVSCKTGITHQVRVHLASVGNPLVGDKLYDELYQSRDIKPLWHRLFAYSISFPSETFSIDASEFDSQVDQQENT